MRRPSQPQPRRTSRGLAGLLLLALLLPAAAAAGGDARTAEAKDTDARRRGTPEPITDRQRRREAIRRGCDFLCGTPGSHPAAVGTYKGKQNDDGSFGESRAKVALTALAVLALMADGSTDGRGRHGKAVRRGITFLLELIENPKRGRWPEGYFWHAEDSSSRMHGQGFATLALATALGTNDGKRAARIRTALIQAVRCIEGAQTELGGFGYQPTPKQDHEGSVTVAVAQGLRAARDAGILVDDNVVRKGLYYLKRSQKSTQDEEDGSFQYSLHQDQSSYALTAAALSSFFLYGKYRDDPSRTLERGIRYMRTKLEKRVDLAWYYYGHFYAAWACWQWDGHTWADNGENLWAWWQNRVYPDLLERQLHTGAFQPDSGRYDYGEVLSTSFAVLTLAIPDEMLPIFQR